MVEPPPGARKRPRWDAPAAAAPAPGTVPSAAPSAAATPAPAPPTAPAPPVPAKKTPAEILAGLRRAKAALAQQKELAARAAAARAERGQAVLLSLEAAAGAATWRPGDAALHRRFPRRFRAAARAVLLAALATAGRTARGAPDDAPVAFGDLPLDVVLHEILPRLAFPLSAWIGEEE